MFSDILAPFFIWNFRLISLRDRHHLAIIGSRNDSLLDTIKTHDDYIRMELVSRPQMNPAANTFSPLHGHLSVFNAWWYAWEILICPMYAKRERKSRTGSWMKFYTRLVIRLLWKMFSLLCLHTEKLFSIWWLNFIICFHLFPEHTLNASEGLFYCVHAELAKQIFSYTRNFCALLRPQPLLEWSNFHVSLGEYPMTDDALRTKLEFTFYQNAKISNLGNCFPIYLCLISFSKKVPSCVI